MEAGVPKKWRDTERGEEIGKAREGEREEKRKRASKILSSFCNLILLSGALITVSMFLKLYRFYLIELGLSAAAGNGKMHLIKVKPSNKSQSLKRKWKQKVQP